MAIETMPDEKVEEQTLILPPYNVIMANDDDHSMGFVMAVLQKALGYDGQKCYLLMTEAHESGQAVVWTGSKEVAELKHDQMISFHEDRDGRDLGPLTVYIEPAQ